jgi:hypothetical protein
MVREHKVYTHGDLILIFEATKPSPWDKHIQDTKIGDGYKFANERKVSHSLANEEE